MTQAQSIPCPDCGTAIHFSVELLVQGGEFTCPGCGTRLGLSSDGIKQTQQAIDKLRELKDKVLSDGGHKG